MRHPNLVILLGACPEHGCLVYEYMENICLDDRLFCKDGTPPLPWFTRFRIATEVATALNFLHQTRPDAIVHRDLKPANILLDRNFVSKISDVGLSTLVPASVADKITQYRLTAAVGTFCYPSPSTPKLNNRNFSGGGDEAEDLDPYGGLFDDEQTRILSIKEQLEDPQQSEDAVVVELLQNLADMDITFQALKGFGAVVGAISHNPADLQDRSGSYLSIYDEPSLSFQDPVVDSIKSAVDRLTHSTNFLEFLGQHALIMPDEALNPAVENVDDQRYHFMSLLLNLASTFLYMVNTYIIVRTADDYSMSLGTAPTVCGIVIGAMAVAQIFSSVIHISNFQITPVFIYRSIVRKFSYIECSAKTQQNVKGVFDAAIKVVLQPPKQMKKKKKIRNAHKRCTIL